MHIVRFTSLDELATYAEEWDRICGNVPFRSWDWASTWWQYYGQHWYASRELFVLGVFDSRGNLVGLAPWYVERSVAFGRVVRFLGSGEVCSDYLDILAQAGLENEVAAVLADWLAAELSNYADLVELKAVDARGSTAVKLMDFLGRAACTTHRRSGISFWQIDLPPSVDEYIAKLSRNGRKQFRRIERRMVDSGRAVLRTAQTIGELEEFMEILIDLHKRRFFVNGRQTSSNTDRFWNFHRDLAQRMLLAGQVRLHILDIDGIPAAAEYHFSGGGTPYAYQAGIDPDRLGMSPGNVVMVTLVHWAIAQGYRTFNLMRGDEPYKAHWRAKPHKSLEIRIVPSRISPQLRHSVWLAGTSTYKWLKDGAKKFVLTKNG